jgi:putative transposase
LLKAYKYRIYPNKEQKQYFAKIFGCVRFIYNRMLADKIEYFKLTGKMLKNTPAQYKKEFLWLKEADSLALANAQLSLNAAYKNFFRDKSVGFPQFKSKKSYRFSYTTNNQHGTVCIENGRVRLPKLKSLVRIKQHRQFDGKIKSCTVSKTPAGKYFISLLIDTEIQQLPQAVGRVGIDVGVKKFAVLSDGTTYANPKHLRKAEKKLALLQRSLSRKKKGSVSRKKARLKVARLHEKIANQRKDFLHKASTKVISENQAVVIEDLKVKKLLQKRQISKFIAEISWSEFRRMLEYKAVWHGREIIVAPSDYASSQLCSRCNSRSSKTKDLSCRTYICPACGLIIDRDYNASLNLLKLAV